MKSHFTASKGLLVLLVLVFVCMMFLNFFTILEKRDPLAVNNQKYQSSKSLRVSDRANGGSLVQPKNQSQSSNHNSFFLSNTNSKVDTSNKELISHERKQRKKIAYAITVTRDGKFVDGALVLGYAAKKVHDISKGFESKYDAELVAFVAPSVVSSRPILEKYGWKVIEKPLPVSIEDIENQDYATKMKNSGCCGADEFLKLWAFTLEEYHRVVHLDMDSIIFNNMDELYEIDKELLFTGDYNMKGNSPVAPAQGGFLVIRPSLKTFEEFRSIIRKGDHTGKGWEGSRIGNFWGGQTIQGIIPFFYKVKQPDGGKEVNRCVYNCMVDNPYRPKTTQCLDKKPTCQDCRLQNPDLVKSAHFTICQKPWTCTKHLNPKNMVLCEIFHKKWFALRDELEQELNLDTSYRKKDTKFINSMGMCKGYGDDKYISIPIANRINF